MQARQAYSRLAGLGCVILAFAIDQTTKAAALAAAPILTDGIEVLPFFNLVLVKNRGVTFGMFATGHPVGQWVLILFTAVITAGVMVWLTRVRSRIQAAALGLIGGGALGNLMDRLRHGAVTDFLDFHIQHYHWPAFNLADTSIVIGAALLFIKSSMPASPSPESGGHQKRSHIHQRYPRDDPG